jgi:hypothetical protein
MPVLAEHQVTEIESGVIFGVLLAQVADIHTMMWNFDAEQDALLEPLHTAYAAIDNPAARAITASLAVAAFDIDPLELSETEWEAAEQILASLSSRWGTWDTPTDEDPSTTTRTTP